MNKKNTLYLKKILHDHKIFLFLLPLFILSRIVNLTALPVFNDEAIYIDWGWRMLNLPEQLYYSLYDGKQPLLMWLFGISQSLVDDQLWASRFVSVVASIVSCVGLYLLSKFVLSTRVALYTALLYLTAPLFLFFDRQALMESAVTAIGIWALFLYLKLTEKPLYRYSVPLGLIIGVGLFIKTTVILFVISLVLLFIVNVKKYSKNKEVLFQLFFAILISQVVLIPLYMESDFWRTLGMNNRFMLSPLEVLKFPFLLWLKNMLAVLEILFWHITPLFCIAFFVGMYSATKHESEEKLKKVTLYVFFLLSFFIVYTKNPSIRYVVALLPLVLLIAAYGFNHYTHKIKYFLLVIIFPLSASLFQISNPTEYLKTMSKLTSYSQVEEYVYGWTSGKAAQEAADYLKHTIANNTAIISVRTDAGNPENTIFYSFNKNKNTQVIYFDQNIFPELIQYECLNSAIPLYFVSRDTHLTNMERFWTEEKRFYNEGMQTSVGIYSLKKNCVGNTLELYK